MGGRASVLVLTWLACAGAQALGAAGAPAQPATRPVRQAAAGVAPAPRPAAPPTTAPHSDVGQRVIRRDPGRTTTGPTTAAASTQPASAAAPVASVAPKLELPKVAGALAVVLGLAFVLRAVLRRVFPAVSSAGATHAIQVLSRTVLAPRQQLMLVRVGRRLVVVGDSGGQMTALSEITDPDEVASLVGQVKDEKLSAAGATFGGLLGRVRGMDVATDVPPREAVNDEPGALNPGVRPNGEDEEEDAEISSTRRELDGLLEKVRLISHQFKGTRA